MRHNLTLAFLIHGGARIISGIPSNDSFLWITVQNIPYVLNFKGVTMFPLAKTWIFKGFSKVKRNFDKLVTVLVLHCFKTSEPSNCFFVTLVL